MRIKYKWVHGILEDCGYTLMRTWPRRCHVYRKGHIVRTFSPENGTVPLVVFILTLIDIYYNG